MRIRQAQMLYSEVLELEWQGSLALCTDSVLALKVLAVFAAGILHLHPRDASRGPMTALQRMFFRSGAAILPWYKGLLSAEKPWTGVRLLDHVREEANAWTVRVPASFRPSSRSECCCRACLECLARSGVPIPGFTG